VIFIDRSIPRGVAEAVKELRQDIIWLEDEFSHDGPDEEWLAVTGLKGWLVITHDRKIRTRPGERRAIMEHGVGCFIMTYRQDLKREEIGQFRTDLSSGRLLPRRSLLALLRKTALFALGLDPRE
jgi:hypothetical protein